MSCNVTVTVPATTANLGPGFDSLGMALDLWNQFELTIVPSAKGRERKEGLRLVDVVVEGEGAEALPLDADNLVFKAFLAGFEGEQPPQGEVALRVVNRVPLSSGLGSSATAIVGGLAAANALRRQRLSLKRLIELATEIEGHPDNVAPAVLGGLVVSVAEKDGSVCSLSIPLPQELWVCVAVPDFYLNTDYSRARLPERVSRADAVFNLSRSALWIAAMVRGDLEALGIATQDALHQPYRSALIPGLEDVFEAALKAGALGVALSGSGPSVAAFCRGADGEAIGEAMRRAFRKVGVTARTWIVRPATQGATVRIEALSGGSFRDSMFESNVSGGM